MLPNKQSPLRLISIVAATILFSASFNQSASAAATNCKHHCIDSSGITIHERRIIPGKPGQTTKHHEPASNPAPKPLPPKPKPQLPVPTREPLPKEIGLWSCEWPGYSKAELAKSFPDNLVCQGDSNVNKTTSQPPIPPQLIEAARHLPLTKPVLSIQPTGKAWVNVPEIVFTTTPQDQTIHSTILGKPITIHAHTIAYTWHWGDGSDSISHEPGHPYPYETVTHVYTQPGTYKLSLTITVSATYTNANGVTQTIPGTTTLTSNPQPLRVVERHTVLVSPPDEHFTVR